MMLANDYALELRRLQQIGPVEVPHIEGVNMIIKDRLDAHTYDPHFLKHLKTSDNNQILPDDIEQLRQSSGQKNQTTSVNGVEVQHFIANEMGRKVKYVKVYQTDKHETEKAMIYVHGGGYFGGSAEEMLFPLQLMARTFDGVIYDVEYKKCPEYPYPASIQDVLAMVSFVSKQHRSITLSGDSAGAAIALGVSQLVKELGICQIDHHILFYPTVVHGSNINGPLWDDKKISIIPDQRKYLHHNYAKYKQLDRVMTHFYLNGKDIKLDCPIISPLYADPTTFSDLTILVGEFDPFRLQAESFAQEVGTSGVNVKLIRYGGMGHAFLNYIGQCPAAEDSIREAIKAMK